MKIVSLTLLFLISLCGNSQSLQDKEAVKAIMDRVNKYISLLILMAMNFFLQYKGLFFGAGSCSKFNFLTNTLTDCYEQFT